MTTLTPELLADLRKKAEAAGRATWSLERDESGPRYVVSGVIPIANVYSSDAADAEHMAAANPATVIALLNRIEALEAKWERPSQWRCDGCGAIERPDDGRRPDRHDGCGGVWIRQERTDA